MMANASESSLSVLPPALPAIADASPPATSWRDFIGILASVGCAIHCAAMPLVVAWLPALGLSFLADESFHQWMAVICFAIAMAAFVPGFRRHRRVLPIAIATVGLALLGGAAFALAGECCASCETVAAASDTITAPCTDTCCEHCVASAPPDPTTTESVSTTTVVAAGVGLPTWLSGVAAWITPLGGLLLVAAHLLNRHYGCRCDCCLPAPSAKDVA